MLTTNTIAKNDFRDAFVYDILINEDTSFYEVMSLIQEGLLNKNMSVFGDYIKEYADNPIPSSYYLKINVIDATGYSEFYKCSIIKSFEYSTGEYEVYFAYIPTKKFCTKEEYKKLDGSFANKSDFIGKFLEKHFIFKEDRDCKGDECFCCGCGMCEAEDKEEKEEELDKHIVKGESVKKEYDKIKSATSKEDLEKVLHEAMQVHNEMVSKIKNANKSEKESKKEDNDKEKERFREAELIKKLFNIRYSLYGTNLGMLEDMIKEIPDDVNNCMDLAEFISHLLNTRKDSKKE